ncbi:hypothetical protein SEUCBS139899_007489 [Sporothrix eucalyptigena]|uniref:Uncharacterized protein n=1 Tax=Sporothrix eucalyptigena TaxID=1812306 RepID=A0ABP0C9B9_9PEZI
MRFSAALFVGVFAAIATAQSSSGSAAATTVSTANTATSSTQAAINKCLDACAADDVSCRAKCIAVPDPNAAQANATNNCVAGCPQGNGTASDNLQYADCVAACIGANYFTSTGTPAQTTGAAAAGSGTAATGTTTGTASGTKTGSATDKTGTASGTGTATGSSTSATTTKNAGETLRVTTSAFGLLGLVAAVLAL